ncbi:MAG: ribosomal L7Ae/L30e/S12e/Gadd45 family protein [Clostridia bacterium]|nr:ribosomal L7Ae/L30e/S12e/Gadd45 family protein [Clostridia bacterium]
MTVDKLTGLLGMCRRAGRLVTGFDAVVALCQTDQATVLIAADAAERTVKELRFRMPTQPIHRMPFSKEEAARVIGSHKPVAVLATADAGFSKAILQYVEPIEEEESHYDD